MAYGAQVGHLNCKIVSDLIKLVALGTHVWSGAGNGVDSHKPHDIEATCSQITSPGGKSNSHSFWISVQFPALKFTTKMGTVSVIKTMQLKHFRLILPL